MTVVLYVVFMILAVTLQRSIVPLFSINDITPDIILITTMAISLQQGRVWGVVAGFLAGLAFDMTGTEFVGLSSLAKSVAAYLVGILVAERLERRLGNIIGFLFAVILIHDSLYFFILSIGTHVGFWSTLFKVVLPTTLYTLVFVVIMHLLWPRLLWGKTNW